MNLVWKCNGNFFHQAFSFFFPRVPCAPRGSFTRPKTGLCLTARRAPRFGDRAKHVGYGAAFASPRIVSGVPRQVALTDDAHHLSPVVDNGKPPNPMARHLAHAFPGGILGVAGESPVGHTVDHNRGARVRFVGHEPHRDVTVRYHSYEAAFLVDYRKRPEIIITHQPRRVSDTVFGINCDHIARHQFARAYVVDGVSGTPIISLPPAPLVFIIISAAAPPFGLLVAEPRAQFISRAPEESTRPSVSFPSDAGFVIHIIVTRHFNPPSVIVSILPSFLFLTPNAVTDLILASLFLKSRYAHERKPVSRRRAHERNAPKSARDALKRRKRAT